MLNLSCYVKSISISIFRRCLRPEAVQKCEKNLLTEDQFNSLESGQESEGSGKDL